MRARTNLIFVSLIWILLTGPLHALELVYEAASPQIYAHPHDLVLSADQQRLYVADNGNDRIAVLDPDTLKLIGTLADDEVSEPHDVAFDAAGHLLVADTGNDRIAIYKLGDMRVQLVGELDESLRRPEGIAVGPDGRVYATGAASDNLVIYDQGKIVHEQSGLSAPHDVDIAPDRSIWIADAGNDRMVNLSADFKLIHILKGKPYGFSGPRYLDFDAQSRLYIADKYSHQIKILDKKGDLLKVLGSASVTFGPGYFNRPEGVAINDKHVWFSDTYNDRIVRYRIVD